MRFRFITLSLHLAALLAFAVLPSCDKDPLNNGTSNSGETGSGGENGGNSGKNDGGNSGSAASCSLPSGEWKEWKGSNTYSGTLNLSANQFKLLVNF